MSIRNWRTAELLTLPVVERLLARARSAEMVELLRHPGLEPAAQQLLFQTVRAEPHDLMQLAWNPSLTPELVDQLLATGDSLALGMLAVNPVVSDSVSEVLAATLGVHALAGNPSLSASMRARVLHWLDSTVLEEDDFLARLDHGVALSRFVRRTDLTVDELELLRHRLDPGLMEMLAVNPALSPECRSLLLDWSLDPDSDLSLAFLTESARAALVSLPELLGLLAQLPEDPDHRELLSLHPALSLELQRELLEEGFVAQLAANKGVHAELQRELLEHPAAAVARPYLAKNPALTPGLQRELLTAYPELRSFLGGNPGADPEILLEIALTPVAPDSEIWYNERLPLADEIPVPNLLPHRRDALLELCEARGLDLVAFESLLDDWLGTLGELLLATRELGPELSPVNRYATA